MANLSDILTNYQSVDTLDSVTDRGATTTNAITIGNLTSTGIDDNATSTALTIDASGNVGIGTASPSSYSYTSELVVDTGLAGGITVVSDSTAGGYGALYFADGTTGNEQYRGFFQYNHNNTGTDEMLIGTAGATRLTIDANGKVGIGTTSPADYHSLSQFVVAQSGDAGITIASGTSNDGRIFFADGTSGSAESEGTIRYDHSDNSMHFSTTDAVRLSISAGGNVGIGAAPADANQSFISSSYTELLVKGNSSNKIGTVQVRSGDPSSYNAIELAAAQSQDLSYVWSGTNTSMIFGTSNSERMRISNGGYIGIGTSAPGFKVDIKNGSAIGLWVEGSDNGYTQGAIVSSSGTTDTPQARGQGLFIFNHGTDTTWYIGGLYNSPDRFDICRQGSTTSFAQSTAQTTYSLATFSNSGNLSIDGTLTQNSDVSIKDNVQNLPNQLDTINALRPVEYDRNDKLKAGEHEIGLIAQEVEALLPDLVGDRNGLKTLDYARLSVILLKGLQELSAKVAALEAN